MLSAEEQAFLDVECEQLCALANDWETTMVWQDLSPQTWQFIKQHGFLGMAHAGDLRKVGRVGLKSVIYFEAMTTIALVIGAVLAYATRPGAGMNVNLNSLDAGSLATYTEHAKSLKDTAGFLLKIIPDTAINAFATGDILQILVFSVLFGSALSLLGKRAQRVSGLIDELSQVFFRVMGFIIKLAPLGVLGAIAFTTGTYGVESLKQLGMTPLIDVMLVLLVIFIITAPLFSHAIRLDLPKVAAAPARQTPQTISLSIDGAGKLYWNGKPITLAQMRAQFAEAGKRADQPDIQLRAERSTRYEVIAQVMGAAQQAGLERIGFVTDPPPPAAQH